MFLESNQHSFLPIKLHSTMQTLQNTDQLELLLKRDLNVPDWTLEQLWQISVYHYLKASYNWALQAYHRLLQWTEHDPSEHAAVLVATAHCFIALNDYPQALTCLQAAYKLSAQPVFLFYLAETYQLNSELPQAFQSYQTFLNTYQEVDHFKAHAFMQSVKLLDQTGQSQQAQQMLLQATQTLNCAFFGFQAQSYQALLSVQEAEPLALELPTEPKFIDALYTLFFYREQYRSLDALEAIRPKAQELQSLFRSSLSDFTPWSAIRQKRIVVIGDLSNSEAEPYLDTLVAMARVNSVRFLSIEPLPDYLKQEDWLSLTQLNPQFSTLTGLLQDLKPDLILYMDLGPHHSMYYLLASLQLAPVQAAIGTRGVSTSLDSIQYYLSFDWLLQDQGVQNNQNYSERIIALPGTPKKSAHLPKRFLERGMFHLPQEFKHYLCPLPPNSLHKEFIPILAEILNLDPLAQILIPNSSNSRLDQLFKQIFMKQYPDVSERLHLLPNINRRAFLSLAKEVDLILDPVYMGLSQSLWQLIPLGTPILTWAGPHAGGRFASALYQKINLSDSIAPTLSEYAALALKLAHDPSSKEKFQTHLAEHGTGIFEFETYSNAFLEFIEQALDESMQKSAPAEVAS